MGTEVVLSSRESWWILYIQDWVTVGLFRFCCSILYLRTWPLVVLRCGRDLASSCHCWGCLEVYWNAQIIIGGRVGLFITGTVYKVGLMLMTGSDLIGVWLMVLSGGLGFGGGVYKSQVWRWRLLWQVMELRDQVIDDKLWGLTSYGVVIHQVCEYWCSLGDNDKLEVCILWEVGDCAGTHSDRFYEYLIWFLWKKGQFFMRLSYLRK